MIIGMLMAILLFVGRLFGVGRTRYEYNPRTRRIERF